MYDHDKYAKPFEILNETKFKETMCFFSNSSHWDLFRDVYPSFIHVNKIFFLDLPEDPVFGPWYNLCF
jgi:hypothetical protein